MYSDAEEANSHARQGKQEEHGLAERQFPEMKTRRNPLQSKHWAPENCSALTLSQLETEGELMMFIVSENTKHAFLSMKCHRMWKHCVCVVFIYLFIFLVFWSIIHIRSIHILFQTSHYCQGQEVKSWRTLGLGLGSPDKPTSQSKCSGNRLCGALPSRSWVSPRKEMPPPLWAAFPVLDHNLKVFPYAKPTFLVLQFESIVSHP